MLCDLYLPFPQPQTLVSSSTGQQKSKKDKGKEKALAQDASATEKTSCWTGLAGSEREEVGNIVGMAGHLGYTVIALSVSPTQAGQIPTNPFVNGVPFPLLDPRQNAVASTSTQAQKIIQLSRLHITIDDSVQHGLISSNTVPLSSFDILSVTPTTSQAFQSACLNLTQPGPNQVTIISLPLDSSSGRMGFFLKRSLVKSALRNGAVFELPYLSSIAPAHQTEQSRRARQSFLTNARELIRVIGGKGKGVIFSSGPSGSGSGGWGGMKGGGDLVNLACILGMQANEARISISETPRTVVLRAQARRNYKGVMTNPVTISLPDQIAGLKAKALAEKKVRMAKMREEQIARGGKGKKNSNRKGVAKKVIGEKHVDEVVRMDVDGAEGKDWSSKKIPLV